MTPLASERAHWQRYTQDELERQYNARATVPDVEPFLRAYREASDAAYASTPGVRHLRYGDAPEEVIDLFPAAPLGAAAPAGGAPLFVFVHGGYWRALGRRDSAFMAPILQRAGIATAVVEYSLAPAARLHDIVGQCRQALLFLYRHAQSHGVNPRGMVLAGSSAGAHLAAMMLSSHWQQAAGLPPDVVRGAVLMSGLYDLAPVQRTVPNSWLHLSEEDAQSLSPLLQRPQPSVRLEIVVAEHDTDEFKRQSALYGQVCGSHGCAVSLLEQGGRNHFDVVMEWMQPQSDISRRTLALFSA